MASLFDQSTQYPLLIPLTTIGSHSACTLCFSEGSLHPNHALIEVTKGAFCITPFTRSTLIYVNGHKIKKHTLQDGDLIQLGDVYLTFTLFLSTVSSPLLQNSNDEIEHAKFELEAYRRLGSFSQQLASHTHRDELFEALLEELIKLTQADQGFVLSVRSNESALLKENIQVKEHLQVCASHLNEDHPLDEEETLMSDSVIQSVIRKQTPLLISHIHDLQNSPSQSMMSLGLCSVMCVPLLFQNEFLGLIYLGNHQPTHAFNQHMLEVLEIFSTQVAILIKNSLLRENLSQDNRRLRHALEDQRYGSIIGKSPIMQTLFHQIDLVADTEANVLIFGETGTGKELIARELHRRSKRKNGPFVAINCGAIPEGLIESELFGHVKGSFTGATQDKKGQFSNAHQGTLFLDEIGEMSMSLQVKLLRVLQEREVVPIGASHPHNIDIRLISATHVELLDAVHHHYFRQDLYYRINTIQLTTPPLRKRGDDILLLVKYLIQRFASQYKCPSKPLSKKAEMMVRKYAWPGNIRELENRVSQALILADGSEIFPQDLGLDQQMLVGHLKPLNEAKEAFAHEYIEQVLHLNRGNRTQTARDLGVDPRTIFRYLERGKTE
jgi:transcriptional regulator with GAF, ATPase, and Fis domain